MNTLHPTAPVCPPQTPDSMTAAEFTSAFLVKTQINTESDERPRFLGEVRTEATAGTNQPATNEVGE